MDGKVVERVELAAKEVVYEGCVGLECMLCDGTYSRPDDVLVVL